MQCCEFVAFKVCRANNGYRERWVGRLVCRSNGMIRKCIKGFDGNVENLIPLPNGHYHSNTTLTHALIYSHYMTNLAAYISAILSICASAPHRFSKFMMPLLLSIRHYLLNFIFSDETWFSWILTIKKRVSRFPNTWNSALIAPSGMSNGSKWGIN